MFKNLSIKQIFAIFLPILLIVAIIQIIMFLYSNSAVIHFGISFLALFIALLLFHSVNIKMKQKRKK